MAAFVETKGSIAATRFFMDELYQKYKMMETQKLQTKGSLFQKVPETRRTISVLEHLKKKQESEETVVTDFPLSEQVYAEAELVDVNHVSLWLGVCHLFILFLCCKSPPFSFCSHTMC
jgi:hypothetical protein